MFNLKMQVFIYAAAFASLASATMEVSKLDQQLKGAPASSGATVILGHARFTVLTDRLFRLEFSLNSTFDDSATLTIINRALPVPHFTVSNPNSSSVQITTTELTLLYVDTANPNRNKTCTPPQSGTDQQGGSRVPAYPNGTAVQTVGECCVLCTTDANCNAWVFEPDGSSATCWLLQGVTATVPATNRTFGFAQAPSPFTPDNLQITYNGANSGVWVPGTNVSNLGGTYRALDCYTTPMQCVDLYWTSSLLPGLLSQDGPVIIDDTMIARMTDEDPSDPVIPWPWWMNSSLLLADWYFNGYQKDYTGFLSTWTQLSGAVAMPRRAAFGLWWSRYWTYSAATIESEVLSGYANYSIPLSVLVMDMDWHDEPTDKTCASWGNFDFNETLFPDPAGFIADVRSGNTIVGRPLEMSLNVHPQTGVDHCDVHYAEIAMRMGVDPATNVTIPCDMGNKTFVKALYDIYFNAMPLGTVPGYDGNSIGTWWTDYGGCGGPAGQQPVQLWSNIVYDNEIKYNATKNERPQVLSRNGGLGSQRYPLSFSGDSFQHEVTLDFLVQTTAMASNALLPYWSHDVGGFHRAYSGDSAPGDADPTNFTGSLLMLRWYQFAITSPIFRTHCDHCIRTVWSFEYVFPWLRDAMVLRQALVPYLYSLAREAYDTGVPPLRPMYYGWPQAPEAYTYTRQYMFGPRVLASPLTTVEWSGNGLANSTSRDTWLPAGRWAFWDGAAVYQGPGIATRKYGFSETPLFVPAGALLPLGDNDLANVIRTSPDLVWTLFHDPTAPGESTTDTAFVYEDDGITQSYTSAPGANTTATGVVSGSTITLTVQAVVGFYPGIPSTRAHSLQVRSSINLTPSSVEVNGAAVSQIVPGSAAPGWYIVPLSMHSLTTPQGSLVVNAGPSFMVADCKISVTLFG